MVRPRTHWNIAFNGKKELAGRAFIKDGGTSTFTYITSNTLTTAVILASIPSPLNMYTNINLQSNTKLALKFFV